MIDFLWRCRFATGEERKTVKFKRQEKKNTEKKNTVTKDLISPTRNGGFISSSQLDRTRLYDSRSALAKALT